MSFEHNRDEGATGLREFSSPDSYVSSDGHEYLAGADRSARRLEVYRRDRGRCWKCGERIPWEFGEMDHIEGGLGAQRCDCLHNLRWACGEDHRDKHVAVRRAVDA